MPTFHGEPGQLLLQPCPAPATSGKTRECFRSPLAPPINLGDFFTTDEYKNGFQSLGVNLNLSQYTVYLIGTLDNSPADNPITGGILALDASTGPLILGVQIFVFSGRIDQGTITTDGTDDLIANFGTLDGVTLDGTLDMSGFIPGFIPSSVSWAV